MLLKDNIVEQIRLRAAQNTPPSQILREVLSQLPPEERSRQTLVLYVSEAFCFKEGQGQTIFGWLPEGTGYLQDAELDYLLNKKIEQTRTHWENKTINR